jgi:hypothetical protein
MTSRSLKKSGEGILEIPKLHETQLTKTFVAQQRQ